LITRSAMCATVLAMGQPHNWQLSGLNQGLVS
jgi:hypothetical protein